MVSNRPKASRLLPRYSTFVPMLAKPAGRAGEKRPMMPNWLKLAAGVALTVSLLAIAGVKAYSERLGPLVQKYGITYYNGDGPSAPSAVCRPEQEILAAIGQVHAKFDYLAGDGLKAF